MTFTYLYYFIIYKDYKYSILKKPSHRYVFDIIIDEFNKKLAMLKY